MLVFEIMKFAIAFYRIALGIIHKHHLSIAINFDDIAIAATRNRSEHNNSFLPS